MKRCRYCRQENKKRCGYDRSVGEKTGGARAGAGKVGWEMGQTSLSSHLEVPEIITEGAAPAGTHGRVVQTGGHTLGYSLVPELHPALGVVLAVLGPLFPSRGRGRRCLLLAPHEPACVPERAAVMGTDAAATHWMAHLLSSQNLPTDQGPTPRSL